MGKCTKFELFCLADWGSMMALCRSTCTSWKIMLGRRSKPSCFQQGGIKANLILCRYCKRVYDATDPAKKDIFLTLLKVYLRPRRDSDYVPAKSAPTKALFAPALSLLATQGTKMDAAAVLDLLPPLLTVQDLQIFLQKAVRRSVQTKNARKVEKRVWRARQDQVERTLVDLEGRRVKITDGRLCPQCHKRLGNSVIAIHSPG